MHKQDNQRLWDDYMKDHNDEAIQKEFCLWIIGEGILLIKYTAWRTQSPQKEQKNELEIVVPWLHSKYVGVFSPPLYFVEELKHKTFDGLFLLQQESLPD